MIKFSREKILLLHKLITEETGGDPNIRDLNLLDSALETAFQTTHLLTEIKEMDID